MAGQAFRITAQPGAIVRALQQLPPDDFALI
jgi:hypothetical protein